jgi:hypothetical protein
MSHKPWNVVSLDTVQASAGDDASAKGYIQLDGTNGEFKGDGIPLHAITGWKYEAYTAGQQHIIEADYSGVTEAADHEYTITVKFASDVITSYTFSVVYDVAPANEGVIVTDLVAEINSTMTDLGLTATDEGSNVLSITVDAIADGEIIVSDSEGLSWADQQAYLAPVGTAAEVTDQAGSAISGGTYDRLKIFWNRETRHNGVSGAIVATAIESKLYVEEGVSAANAAALKTQLENILNGLPVAGAVGALTDSTSGTTDDTVSDVSTAVSGIDVTTTGTAASKADVDTRLGAINDNFAELTTKVNAIQAALDSGIWTGVASL